MYERKCTVFVAASKQIEHIHDVAVRSQSQCNFNRMIYNNFKTEQSVIKKNSKYSSLLTIYSFSHLERIPNAFSL